MQHIYAVGETVLDIIFRDDQPIAGRLGPVGRGSLPTCFRLGPSQSSRPVPVRHALILDRKSVV